MALVETDQPNVLKLIQAADFLVNLPQISTTRPSDRMLAERPGLTQVVRIEHTDATKLTSLLNKFMTPRAGNILPIPESNLLVITDYTSNVMKVMEVIELLDVPRPKIELRIIPVEHVAAEKLAVQVTKVLADEQAVAGGVSKATTARISAAQDGRSLIIVAEPADLARIRELAGLFDVDPGIEDRIYSLQYLQADRAKSLLEALLKGAPDAAGAAPSFSIHADTTSNLLIVWADRATHKKISEYTARFDQPGAVAGPTELRVYRLLNARVEDIVRSLEGLLQAQVTVTAEVVSSTSKVGRREGFTGPPPVGPNLPVMPGRAELPRPPAYTGSGPLGRPSAAPQVPLSLQADDVTITTEPNSNSLIVVAPSQRHEQIKSLLDVLDKRRPQVLIEMLLVTIDSSDSLSVGIELERIELSGMGTDYLIFTSFGLSGVDPATGERSLSGSAGLNTAVIRPDQVPIILKALASEADARVISSPRILVADNSSATLDSTAEQPFTSINASDTVATTTFAGYAQAGTRLQVSPRISEGDYVELDFSISLSSFAGEGGGGIPPPRSTNSLSSQVRVPDGYTVIVGGLTSEHQQETIAKVPLVGDIPWLGMLFQTRTRSKARSTLYAFIKPVILREDRFEDLKYISTSDLAKADIGRKDTPAMEPQWMDVTE